MQWQILITMFALIAGLNGFQQKMHAQQAAKVNDQGAHQITESWLSKVKNKIGLMEYHINQSSSNGTWQSPNRAQDLRIFYTADQVKMKPRTNNAKEASWSISLTTKGLYADGNLLQSTKPKAKASVVDSQIVFKQGLFDIEYINRKAGLRQNFLVHPLDQHPDQIAIKLQADELNINQMGDQALHFYQKSGNTIEKKLTYDDLKVWDAQGKPLAANFKVNGQNISIQVNTANATFPVKIDPLTSTSDWSAESNQSDAHFGVSVSSAGDVNGDGYSDVIVGAEQFDNGTYREGRAFLYHGSSTGLSSSADWAKSNSNLGARFGSSVSTAGDVNGDGYSDVIVGAKRYEDGNNSEGRIYVYHGSSNGLATSASLKKESNADQAYFGASVASAGDINGDGYSDVIVGAYRYKTNKYRQGKAYVFQGSSNGLNSSASWTKEGSVKQIRFGYSVATAGDVNGDGYDDVIIGANTYSYNGDKSNKYGRAYVFHGSSSGLSNSSSWTDSTTQADSEYGHSVSTAGDVNGDGYADVIVGAPYYDNGQTDEGQAFIYHGSSSGINNSANATRDNDQSNSNFGFSVSSLGDVNGDGYADVIIGAKDFENKASQGSEGAAYVYRGSASGLESSNSWFDDGDQSSADYGWSVGFAGDVNGDGYADAIVGAKSYDNGESNEGKAFVYHGGPSGLSNSSDHSTEGNQSNAQYGYSIASAGDVNGDGYSDVIIGARYYDNGQTNEGRAFLYHGSSSGLSSSADWTAESDQNGANFGQSVSTAGDVNNDGYSDVIISAFDYDNNKTNEGRVYIYHGSSTGLSSSANTTIDGGQQDAEFGNSVSTAGDVNGDGYSDIIVGAHQYDNGQSNEGRVFVYHGSSSGVSSSSDWDTESDQQDAYYGNSVSNAGDVNGDGYADVLIGAHQYDDGQNDEGRVDVYHGSSNGLSSSPDLKLNGNQADANFGNSVSNAGDVNGDGFGDIIIGAENYEIGGVDKGQVYVHHGSGSGLSNSADWTKDINQAGASFGQSVASAGDVNGDGYADVLIGAEFYDNIESGEGAAYLYKGSNNGLSASHDWQVESDQSSANMGYDVASAGDVNGDGYSDVMVSALYYSDGETDEGKVFFYHGNGGDNRKRYVRLYEDDLSTPLVPGSGDTDASQFGVGLYAQSPMGPTKAKLEWETVKEGEAFSGSPITKSTSSTNTQSSYTDISVNGTEIKEQIDKISNSALTRLRVRLKYQPSEMTNGQAYSRWFYPAYTTGSGSGGAALPIELRSFTGHARKSGNQLEWTTASETNNDHFTIYQSENGHEWKKLGSKEGAGTTLQSQQYELTDHNPYSGSTYYRLKQTNHDGSSSYSDVIVVNRDEIDKKATNPIDIHPNPVKDEMRLKLKTSSQHRYQVKIVNLLGKPVYKTHLKGNQTKRIHLLNLSPLKPGQYLLQVIGQQETFEKYFLKSKR